MNKSGFCFCISHIKSYQSLWLAVTWLVISRCMKYIWERQMVKECRAMHRSNTINVPLPVSTASFTDTFQTASCAACRRLAILLLWQRFVWFDPFKLSAYADKRIMGSATKLVEARNHLGTVVAPSWMALLHLLDKNIFFLVYSSTKLLVLDVHPSTILPVLYLTVLRA